MVNLIIIAWPFLRALCLLPIRSVQPMSDYWISRPRYSLIMLIDKISVSSFRLSSTPCIRRQFRQKYCSCASSSTERLLIFTIRSVACVWRFVISSSLVFLSLLYSWNLSGISWTESVKFDSCFSPLIWLVVASFEETDISPILDYRFFRQLNKIVTQSGEFKLLVKNIIQNVACLTYLTAV